MILLVIKYCLIGVFVTLIYFGSVLAFGLGRFTAFDMRSVLYFMLLVPIIEECIFRGIIQPFINSKLSKYLLGISVGNIVASMIFSLMHLFTASVAISVLMFIPSIFLGYLRDKSGSIIPSIFTHAIFNVNVFILYDIYRLKEIL